MKIVSQIGWDIRYEIGNIMKKLHKEQVKSIYLAVLKCGWEVMRKGNEILLRNPYTGIMYSCFIHEDRALLKVADY